MTFKKKAIIGIAAGLFAVATVFNMNMLNEKSGSDVSLDDVATMSQAEAESFACPNGCLTTSGMCYCYGFHDKYEKHW